MEWHAIKDQLIDKLTNDDVWINLLSDTTPGNYGVEEWEVQIDYDNFYVDIPNRAFSFKNAEFSGTLIFGASKGDSSFDHKFRKPADGKGIFKFLDKDNLEIEETEIDVDLDIFSDD